MRLSKRAHRVELMAFYILQLTRRLLFQALTQPGHISRIVQQHRFGRQAVTASASGFLIVGFDVARNIEVHHKANVGFINPHAKRHGGDHDLQIITLKSFLHVGALCQLQPGVIGTGADAAALQSGSGVFHFGPAVTVDNAAFAALILHIAQQLLGGLELFQQGITNVRTVKAADLNQRIFKPQQLNDVVPCGFIRGRGQRHYRQLGKTLAQLAKCAIFWPEIVAPL